MHGACVAWVIRVFVTMPVAFPPACAHLTIEYNLFFLSNDEIQSWTLEFVLTAQTNAVAQPALFILYIIKKLNFISIYIKIIPRSGVWASIF